jgi:hypothetical protein
MTLGTVGLVDVMVTSILSLVISVCAAGVPTQIGYMIVGWVIVIVAAFYAWPRWSWLGEYFKDQVVNQALLPAEANAVVSRLFVGSGLQHSALDRPLLAIFQPNGAVKRPDLPIIADLIGSLVPWYWQPHTIRIQQ